MAVDKLTVRNVVKDLEIEVLFGEEYLDNEVIRPVLSRPGVEIYSGYFDLYEFRRIQIMGTKEINLFHMVEREKRLERVDKLFSYIPPAFIFTHNVTDIPEEFFKCAEKYKVPILRSEQVTTTCISLLGTYLSEALAHKKTYHGVMMDINGIGVMLKGRSKIGKSETALQLLMKGHTLICDDRVDIAQPNVGTLIAYCPKMIEKLMEVRGIGIVDVVDLFGAKAFRKQKALQLIVELKSADEKDNVERIGTQIQTELIFDTEVPKVTVYVQPGRNIAALVEVAAMNWRLKTLGKDAAREFSDRLDSIVRR